MEFYEKPIAELIDFQPAESVLAPTPGSEGLDDDWED